MELQQWLVDRGFETVTPLVDGHIHRFARKPGKKKKNAWFIGYDNVTRSGIHFTVAIVGDWSTNEEYKFLPKANEQISPEEIEDSKRKIQAARERAEVERKDKQKEVAKDAQELWDSLPPYSFENSLYLEKKGLTRATAAGFKDHILYVPMKDIDGKIWGIQRIFEDGTKKFLTNQKTKALFCPIGQSGTDRVYLCEGYATGLTVNKAIEYIDSIFVCFTASNLKNVAKEIAKHETFKKIIIAADNDYKTEKRLGTNPGILGALNAATTLEKRGVDCDVVYPKNCAGTDYNDLMCEKGMDEVRRQLGLKTEELTIPQEICNTSPTSSHTHDEKQRAQCDQTSDDSSDSAMVEKPSDKEKIQKEQTSSSNQDTREVGRRKPPIEETTAYKQWLSKKWQGYILHDKTMSQALQAELFDDIMSVRFLLKDTNARRLIYKITDIRKREVELWDNMVEVKGRLARNIFETVGVMPNLRKTEEYLNLWMQHGTLLAKEPAPFLWSNQEGWCFKKLHFHPVKGEFPTWSEFLMRLSAPEDFMAFIWSIFEAKNESRQVLYLHGPSGQDGKSKAIGVIAEVLGKAAGAINPGKGEMNTFFVSKFYGKRLIVWPDCKNSKAIMSGKIRAATSGDLMDIEYKGRAGFTEKVYIKLMVASNQEPEITSGGADMSRLMGITIGESKIKNDPSFPIHLREELPYFLHECAEWYEKKCRNHGDIEVGEATVHFAEDISHQFEEDFELLISKHFRFGNELQYPALDFQQFLIDERIPHRRDFKSYLVRYARREHSVRVVLGRPGPRESLRKRVWMGFTLVDTAPKFQNS